MHKVQEFLTKYSSLLDGKPLPVLAIIDAPLTPSAHYQIVDNLIPDGYTGIMGGHANTVGVFATSKLGLTAHIGLMGVGWKPQGWGEAMEPLHTIVPEVVCMPRDVTHPYQIGYLDDREDDTIYDNPIEDFDAEDIIWAGHYHSVGSYPAKVADQYANVILATTYRKNSIGEYVGTYNPDFRNVVVNSSAGSYASGIMGGACAILRKAFPSKTDTQICDAIVAGAEERVINGKTYRWLDVLGAGDVLSGGVVPVPEPEPEPQPEPEPEPTPEPVPTIVKEIKITVKSNGSTTITEVEK